MTSARSPRTRCGHTLWEEGIRIVTDPARSGRAAGGRAGRRSGHGDPGEPAGGRGGDRHPERAGQGRRSSWSGWTRTRSSPSRADGETGTTRASSPSPRSARTSAARSRCTSSARTTCSARATSRRSTWPTAGNVVFGPAARSLPQLPITVDAEGYLVAQQRLPRAGRTELLGARMSTDRTRPAARPPPSLDDRLGSNELAARRT